MVKKVLVTGAAGFVGRYVAKEFSKVGAEVVGIGRGKFPDFKAWGVSEWHEADISMEALTEFAGKPDIIIHCAGGASVGYSVEYPRQDFCLTVDATSALLDYVRIYSPESRLVYPSSAAVYGQVSSEPIQEISQTSPISPYGIHKLMAENLCKMYADRYGLSISIMRLFSIYGAGLRKQLLWDACNKISENNFSFFGTGKETRDWLHVLDVAKLLLVAADHANQLCPVMNGGSGVGVSVEKVLRMLMHGLKCQQSPIFSSEAKSGDPDTLISNSTLLRELGWSPCMNLEDGIAAYVEWYQQCH